MKTYQLSVKSKDECVSMDLSFNPDLILCFVSPGYKDLDETLDVLVAKYPNAKIAGCSTSGEILNTSVDDETIALTAVSFDTTSVKLVKETIDHAQDSRYVGYKITEGLAGKDLRHIMVFSDGLNVNGAELVKGLKSDVGANISITGGLAGDGADFTRTFVIADGKAQEKQIVGIGFYGASLQIGYGSKGGWDSFGIERKVTKSKDNILYELDGQPALALYKSFLGSKASELPSSGLLFPLSMRDEESELPVVRTILAVSEEDQSLTFAGDIPQGSYVRLMKANIDRLINGAQASANISQNGSKIASDLAILISCVGRRLVLKQLVEEELEAVRTELGERPSITGFYSYGEIAPFGEFAPCQLHNQTMTITTFSE